MVLMTPTSSPSRSGKTLVLHIGDHKTGSTSIQNAFAAGRVTLSEQSLFYPGNFNHNYLSKHVMALAEGKPMPKSRPGMPNLEQIAKRMGKNAADICLLSGEAFEDVPPEALRAALDQIFLPRIPDLRLRIIGYVRPHAARLISDFAERIKIGGPRVMVGDLDTSVEIMNNEGLLPYLPRFSTWRAQFGDRFILRPMLRDRLQGGDVVRDFIHHAFDGVPFEVTGTDQANESLDLTDLMRLKVLQSHCTKKPTKLRHTLGWEFARIVSQMPAPDQRTKLSLHRELAEKIHADYSNDAQAMDREFFDGEPLLEAELDRALETAIETQQSVAPEDYLPAEEIRSLSILSCLIVGMFENHPNDWPKVFQNRRIKAVQGTNKTTSE